ncbi:MAG: hypothetical protein ACC707_18950, partial [Thiohalomonadales bacterium]
QLHELKTLYAISDIYTPSGKKAPRQYVYDYISLLCTTKRGFLKEFRAAVRYIDKLSTSTYKSTLFINLSESEQQKLIKDKLLTKHLADSSLTSKLYRRVLATRSERSFHHFISKQLKTIIYSSSLGWQIVGYDHYQGTPAANPFEYTDPPINS